MHRYRVSWIVAASAATISLVSLFLFFSSSFESPIFAQRMPADRGPSLQIPLPFRVIPGAPAQQPGQVVPHHDHVHLVSGDNEPQANTSLPDNPLIRARWNELLPEERVSVMVYENCHRGVANINTKSTQSFLMGDIDIPGGGSGVVYDKRGHVLTNFHVVEDADDIEVTLFSGRSYPAKRIGADPITDIVVLKIDAPPEELYPISFGDSSRLLVGQKIYAIGNPFGLESTLTSGIISSLNRSIGSRARHRPIRGVVQIDAAINPGNSGGPLLDTAGRLIGINTAIASRVEQSSGVGFAIPANMIQRVVPQILRSGKVVRGDSGIAKVREIDEGLRVLALTPQGAAEKAAIKGPQKIKIRDRSGNTYFEGFRVDPSTADIIVAVNGKPARKVEDFLTLVEENKPGDVVTLTVLRDGRQIDVPLTLD